jgi:MFS family permease
MKDETSPARFRWLPRPLRPPVAMEYRAERVILLVGAAAFFAGYDQNVYGLAAPQIMETFAKSEGEIGPTVALFRTATAFALLIAASADLVGRRRLLLITLFGQALFTLLTGFTQTYEQFVAAQFFTRVFGYAEEMLCFVVVAEEMAAGARGWANGTLSSLYYLGAGVASLVFMAITILPYEWRAIYVIGAVPLFLVAWLRKRLPETQRFAEREQVTRTLSKASATWALLRGIAQQYPGRVIGIIIAASAFGFAISPASVLGATYLQTVYHYAPWQASVLMICCGLVSLGLAIAAGRLSDRIGRRPMAFAIVALAGICFYFFYSGVPSWALPPLWLLAFFGFFSGDALVAGFALEIVPTEYRATVSGLRYVFELACGAVALWLEGRLFHLLGGHGPAIQLCLLAIPITLTALLFLPEPAGKSLEEMTGG